MRNGYFIQSGIKGNDIHEITKFLKKVKPSSIVLMRENFNNSEELQNIIHEIKKLYRIDLNIDEPLFAIDQEGGNVVRIRDINYIPSNYALGKVNNINLTNYAAMLTGYELNINGINWNLAPDLDILKNLGNKVMLERSFSEDALKVADHGVAYIKGITKAGIAATAKHFPGHGYVESDTHEKLPTDSREYTEIINDIYPFLMAIKNNVNSVMMSHVLFSSIDDYPASLSSKFYSMLRNELNFNGLIITDSVNMKSISDNYKINEIVNLSINNGADIIECVDTDMALEIFESMNNMEIKDIERKIVHIKNLIPDNLLKYKPPEDLMKIISYISVEWKRVKILNPENGIIFVFMPYSLTKVNSDINNNIKLLEELKDHGINYQVIDFDNFKDFKDKDKQIIFIGRNENFHENYKIINDKSIGNNCVYVSTSINNDIGLLNEEIGYISAYSTKIDNITYAIYKIFGFS